MIVQPRIRGFICTTAHPVGCAVQVQQQIDYVRCQPSFTNGPKKVVVVGASTGYGLASRIVSAFGSQAATIGVFFEKEADGKRTATAGWYNSIAFEKAARRENLYAKSVNGDAFSDEVKEAVVDLIKKDLDSIDLLIYSVAAPRRIDSKTGQTYKSVLKPIGKSYTNKSFNFDTNRLETITLESASEEDIRQTIAVMGGDDWKLWIDVLSQNQLLANGFMTVAYSYMGPEVTRDIYRNGTIGRAKDHLEATAHQLAQQLQTIHGRAFVSVNKALVTQSSSAIPFIPLYFIILTKIMKEKGIYEDCIQQIYRLFAQHLYSGKNIMGDSQGRIRIDNLELREDIQKEVQKIWPQITDDNIEKFTDISGYREDFLKLFGFGLPSVDYNADVDIDLKF